MHVGFLSAGNRIRSSGNGISSSGNEVISSGNGVISSGNAISSSRNGVIAVQGTAPCMPALATATLATRSPTCSHASASPSLQYRRARLRVSR
eukprot:719118-Rhodomonas_salina.1